MTQQQVVQLVMDAIDDNCSPQEMSQQQYLEVLLDLRDEISMRVNTVQQEINDSEED